MDKPTHMTNTMAGSPSDNKLRALGHCERAMHSTRAIA